MQPYTPRHCRHGQLCRDRLSNLPLRQCEQSCQADNTADDIFDKAFVRDQNDTVKHWAMALQHCIREGCMHYAMVKNVKFNRPWQGNVLYNTSWDLPLPLKICNIPYLWDKNGMDVWTTFFHVKGGNSISSKQILKDDGYMFNCVELQLAKHRIRVIQDPT